MTTYENFLQSNSNIDERENMTDEDQRLNLAYENLSTIPKQLVVNFASFVRILDISCNQFNDVSFLCEFQNLRSLILDHNRIDEKSSFPAMGSLTLLWLNHNRVHLLFPFVKNLQRSCPRLQQLSLMGNPAVPADIDDTTFYQHLQYRLFVVSFFGQLNHLDSRKVTSDERTEATRLYRRPLLERMRTKMQQLQLFTRSTAASQTPQRSAFI